MSSKTTTVVFSAPSASRNRAQAAKASSSEVSPSETSPSRPEAMRCGARTGHVRPGPRSRAQHGVAHVRDGDLGGVGVQDARLGFARCPRAARSVRPGRRRTGRPTRQRIRSGSSSVIPGELGDQARLLPSPASPTIVTSWVDDPQHQLELRLQSVQLHRSRPMNGAPERIRWLHAHPGERFDRSPDPDRARPSPSPSTGGSSVPPELGSGGEEGGLGDDDRIGRRGRLQARGVFTTSPVTRSPTRGP